MSGKKPAYWPEVDVAAVTSDEWGALKRHVIREAGVARARAAEDLLRRLFRLYRGTAPTLSPAAPAGITVRSASPRA